MSEPVPAGWYPDPENPEQWRYWDGNGWTEHRALPSEEDAPVTTGQHISKSATWRSQIDAVRKQAREVRQARDELVQSFGFTSFLKPRSEVGPAKFISDAYFAEGVGGAEALSKGATLQRGEKLFRVLQRMSLVEVKELPGHYSSKTPSVRFRLTNRVGVGYARTQGSYVRGKEKPQVLETGGRVFITSRKVQYVGSHQSRVWPFANLGSIQDRSDAGPWIALPLTSRDRVSGIGYSKGDAFMVSFWLELALAEYQGCRQEWAQSIEELLTEGRS